MDEVRGSTFNATPTNTPNSLNWCDDVEKIASRTGLRREDFDKDEQSYLKAITSMVSPPRLPDTMPPLPDHFVKPALVDDVILKFHNNTRNIVLTGMGGAGKSLIASAVVQSKDTRRYFYDGILWFNDEAHRYNERIFLLKLKCLANQFQALVLSRFFRQGRVFQFKPIDFKTVQDAQKYFHEWQKRHNLRCLLVVDNVWNLVRDNYVFMGFS